MSSLEAAGILKSIAPRQLGLALGPLAFLVVAGLQPLPLSPQANLAVAVVLWMVTWWVSEAIPLPVTALLPMLMFPLLGVRSIEQAAAPYGNQIIFLFFGGFMLALGLEEHQLHKRMALRIIQFTGFSPRRLVLGFMVSTALLSMWISNTATAVMMLPMAVSVLSLLQDQQQRPVDSRFAASLVLSIAYGANIGGMATLIGTPPNLVMAAVLSRECNIEVTFLFWMSRALPIVIVMLVAAYLMLVFVKFRSADMELPQAERVLTLEREKLGPMRLAQWSMGIVFVVVASLWVTQDFLKWLWPGIALNDTTIAILGVVLLFIFPANLKPIRPLLEWKTTKRLPWGILLLFGGGLSMAEALRETGVIDAIGSQFAAAAGGHLWLTVFLLTGVALFLTEVMSNVALVNVLIPVLCGIAAAMQIDPLVLAFPATLAASCAFMLPISTPPNAIIFASGQITVGRMVAVGFWLNMVGWALIVLLSLALIR